MSNDDVMRAAFEVEVCLGYDRQNFLFVRHNGKTIREETDYGQPEDNSFFRDYNWIKPALEEAYKIGWQVALSQQWEVTEGYALVPIKLIERYRKAHEQHLAYDAADTIQPDYELDGYQSVEAELLRACVAAAPAPDREGK